MTSRIIDNNLALKAKNTLARLKSAGTTANKLKALIAANKHGVKTVSEVFNVSRTAIYRWAKELKDEGLELMINNSKHQDGIKLKKHHKKAIKKWLEEKSNISILEVKENIREEFNLEVSKSTVHRAMQEVGFSYITPRKNHYKQDQKEVEDFKKKSSGCNKAR